MSRLAAAILSVALICPACSDDDGGGGPDPLDLDRLTNACIVSSACGVKRYPRVADCIKAYYDLHQRFGLGPMYDRIFNCLADAAGDCDAAFACYGSHKAAGRCDTTYTAKCDGDKNLTCDTLAGPEGDGRVFTFDCSHAGLTCSTRAGGSFEADCTPGTCDVGTPRRCDGDRLLSCKSDGNLELIDCAVQGLVCAKSPLTGALECTGEVDEDCDTTQDNVLTPGCEGSVAVTCVNNRIHHEDCSRRLYNTHCSGGSCVPRGNACTDDFNRCQGDNMQYCLDGNWSTADCAALGLGPCATAVNGADCSDR